MNTLQQKGRMRDVAESSLCNRFLMRFVRTKAGSWDNMLARLEIEDVLAPAYFVTQATKMTCMIWSWLIARTPHKSLPELQPKLKQQRIKITINANVYTRTASNERDLSDTSHAILLFHESTCLQHCLSPCVPLPWIQMESMTSSQSHRKCELWKCQNPSPEHHR